MYKTQVITTFKLMFQMKINESKFYLDVDNRQTFNLGITNSKMAFIYVSSKMTTCTEVVFEFLPRRNFKKSLENLE